MRQPCDNDRGGGETLQLLDGECQGLAATLVEDGALKASSLQLIEGP